MKKIVLFLLILSALPLLYSQKSDVVPYAKYTNPKVISRDDYQKRGQYDSSLVDHFRTLETSGSIESFYQIAVNYAKLGKLDLMFKFLNYYVDKSNDDRLVLADRAFTDVIKITPEWKQIKRKIENKFIESQEGVVDTAQALRLFYLSIDYSLYGDFKDLLELPSTDFEKVDEYQFFQGDKFDTLLLDHSRKYTGSFIEILNSKRFPIEHYAGRYCEEFAYFLLHKIVISKTEMDAIETQFKNGQFDPTSYAVLKDRFLVLFGKKQMYGTQYQWKTDEKTKTSYKQLRPIEDEKNVNLRRAEMKFDTTVEEYMGKYNVVR